MSWTLMIHGGCGAMRPATLAPEAEELARTGLAAALDAGEAVLASGGAPLDAVEAAARVLEDDPAFNAGRGSVLAANGRVELDAAIMDGKDRRAIAVHCCEHVGEQLGRILKVGVDDQDAIAAGKVQPGGQRQLMSVIARNRQLALALNH